MKMAKPSERDIEAAAKLIGVLDSLSRDEYPILGEPTHDEPDWFDSDDIAHLRHLHGLLRKLLKDAPGFPMRVIGGMCFVIFYDENGIIDPDSRTIGLHPRLTNALGDGTRLEHLLRHLPGRALREVVGNLSDTADLAAFRGAIDAAIEARKEPHA